MDQTYSNPIGFLQGTNQTPPFSIQNGMVQSSPKPSHHIATDENRKIQNHWSCL